MTGKPGRPPVDEPRKVRTTFAMTTNEDETIRFAANYLEKSLSVFCREAVVEKANQIYISAQRRGTRK